MALIFDSDEEGEIQEMLDDEDNDDDDDDYVPDGRHSDSDAGFGRKKKKTRYVPGKRNFSSRSSSKSNDVDLDESTTSTGDDNDTTSPVKEKVVKVTVTKPPVAKSPVAKKTPVAKTPVTKSPKPKPVAKSPVAKSPVAKSPKPKKRRKSSTTDVVSSGVEDSPSSLRRSSRSSTKTREISYADADVSEEDMFEDEDIFLKYGEDFDFGAGTKNPSKKNDIKTKHVEEIWSKFKTDVNKKEKVSVKIEKMTNISATTSTAKQNDEPCKIDLSDTTQEQTKTPTPPPTPIVTTIDTTTKQEEDTLKKEIADDSCEKEKKEIDNQSCEKDKKDIDNESCEKDQKDIDHDSCEKDKKEIDHDSCEKDKKEIDDGVCVKDSEVVPTPAEEIPTETPPKSPPKQLESSIVTPQPPTAEEKYTPVTLDEYMRQSDDAENKDNIQKENVTGNGSNNSNPVFHHYPTEKPASNQSENVSGNGSNNPNEGFYQHYPTEKHAYNQSERLEDSRVAAMPQLEDNRFTAPRRDTPVTTARYEDAPGPCITPNVMPRIPTGICHPSKKFKMDTSRSPGINNFLSSSVKKTGGLSSVLNTIEKKKKITILDKSKTDWDSYKSEADIEEELKANRNAGYLDRQEFLQRVDYKQWENEREMRLYSNRK